MWCRFRVKQSGYCSDAAMARRARRRRIAQDNQAFVRWASEGHRTVDCISTASEGHRTKVPMSTVGSIIRDVVAKDGIAGQRGLVASAIVLSLQYRAAVCCIRLNGVPFMFDDQHHVSARRVAAMRQI